MGIPNLGFIIASSAIQGLNERREIEKREAEAELKRQRERLQRQLLEQELEQNRVKDARAERRRLEDSFVNLARDVGTAKRRQKQGGDGLTEIVGPEGNVLRTTSNKVVKLTPQKQKNEDDETRKFKEKLLAQALRKPDENVELIQLLSKDLGIEIPENENFFERHTPDFIKGLGRRALNFIVESLIVPLHP